MKSLLNVFLFVSLFGMMISCTTDSSVSPNGTFGGGGKGGPKGGDGGGSVSKSTSIEFDYEIDVDGNPDLTKVKVNSLGSNNYSVSYTVFAMTGDNPAVKDETVKVTCGTATLELLAPGSTKVTKVSSILNSDGKGSFQFKAIKSGVYSFKAIYTPATTGCAFIKSETGTFTYEK
jgi:hypothetical protein